MLHDNHKPPTETKENNFLGTVIDPKLGLFQKGNTRIVKNGFKSFIFFAKTFLKF